MPGGVRARWGMCVPGEGGHVCPGGMRAGGRGGVRAIHDHPVERQTLVKT